MNKLYVWILAGIILLGIGLRCYNLTAPDISDFHAWRQADTAAFTQGFLVESKNPFYPSVNHFPCEHRGEPFGLVESELPLIPWLASLPLAAMGMDFPPAPYLRSISIFFFALTCIYLFLLVRRLDDDPPTALLAVLAFTILPLSIFFTRTIQPDGPSLFFATGFLYHLMRWVDEDDPRQGALSCLFGALVMLIKISNGYLLFPAIYLFVSRKTLLGALKTPQYWAWGILLLVPAVAWYLHAHQFPWTFGIWEQTGHSKFATRALFTSPEIWRKFSSRLTFDILTWAGVVLMLVGATRFNERRSVRLSAAWAGGFLFLFCAALQGNATHVYYQLPFVLPASILIAVGIRVLWSQRIGGKLLLAGLAAIHLITTYHILLSPRGEWQQGYFDNDVHASIHEGSRLVRKHLKPGEKFISTTSHPALYYNARHRGWFYEGNDTLGFLGCASPEAPTILWDNKDVQAARVAFRNNPELANRMEEIERGKHFSLWRVTKWDDTQSHLAAVGGSHGGRPFEWDCPANTALQGFVASRGDDPRLFTALQPICAPLDGTNQANSQATPPSLGNPAPNSTSEPMQCEPGTWLIGIKTKSRSIVRDLELICGTPEPSTAPQPKSANICPTGQIARGVYGRKGDLIDAIGLHCARPE